MYPPYINASLHGICKCDTYIGFVALQTQKVMVDYAVHMKAPPSVASA